MSQPVASLEGQPRLALALACFAATGLFAVSLSLGPSTLGPAAIFRGLTGSDPLAALIVWQIRLPRALLALAIGAGLGAAGAALQGLLRNPLAEPSVLGAPQAAALGAVLTLYTGLGSAAFYVLPLAAFAGAFAALAVLLAIARRAAGITAFLLAGVAVASAAGALTGLVLSLAPNPFAFSDMSFWLMGSLEDRSFVHVWLAAPAIAAGIFALWLLRDGLRTLTFGEDVARSLGTDTTALRLRVAAAVALIIGAATAVAGAIGFIGLAAPHIARPFTGYDPGRTILPSALTGACLLLASDIAVRLIPATVEIKIGILTSLIGVPLFLWIILTGRHGPGDAA